MQHQSQDLLKGSTAGKTGLLINPVAITGEEIERHIAHGKQLQAEAIGALLTGAFRRLGAVFQRRPVSARDTAMPHGA
jgi:hypothetical protein